MRKSLDKVFCKTRRISKWIMFCSSMVLGISGCSSQNTEVKQNVELSMQQTQEEYESVSYEQENENRIYESNMLESTRMAEEDLRVEVTSHTEAVTYDLTTMGSEMVYAMVYQFMMNPQDYIGETIKMQGTYYSVWYEATQKYYHYCIIQDALACCAQGMEFVWEDGSHSYPEEYPENETEVLITGEFETYQEEGDTSLYCRLKNASMEIVSDS